MPQYPECEKRAAIQDKAQICGEFLEWLGAHGFYVAEEVHRGKPEPEGYEELVQTHKNIEQLLAAFFEIDLAKVEQERRAMLAEIRKNN